MNIRSRAAASQDGLAPSHGTGVLRRTRRIRGIALVVLGILLTSLTLQAGAQTSIYFYVSNSAPVDVTGSYVYQNHLLYDSLGNPVGTVDANGSIYDISDPTKLLGYIDSGAGGGGFP